MLYRSHRGDLYHAPENTMPAFSKAIEGNLFTYLETDPRLTKDKKIILKKMEEHENKEEN